MSGPRLRVVLGSSYAVPVSAGRCSLTIDAFRSIVCLGSARTRVVSRGSLRRGLPRNTWSRASPCPDFDEAAMGADPITHATGAPAPRPT